MIKQTALKFHQIPCRCAFRNTFSLFISSQFCLNPNLVFGEVLNPSSKTFCALLKCALVPILAEAGRRVRWDACPIKVQAISKRCPKYQKSIPMKRESVSDATISLKRYTQETQDNKEHIFGAVGDIAGGQNPLEL